MAPSRTLLVTTVKNEGPNILEWVAHHRLCGFDKIMVFQNGSSDLTVRSLRIMHELGLIEFVNNSGPYGSPQIRAYRKASQSAAFDEADYAMALDGDEFFRCDLPEGTVGALIDATDRAEIIRLNWQNFGSSGQVGLTAGLVTERYTHCRRISYVGTTLEGYKSLFRTDAFSRIGIHQPRFEKRGNWRAVNGSGMENGTYPWKGWRMSDPKGMTLARVHHYPLRDAVSFTLKRARGSAHQGFRDVGLKYWTHFDNADDEDRTLADRAPVTWAEMQRIDRLSDGRLLFLRRKGFRIWRNMFRELMKDPEKSAFFREIRAAQTPIREKEKSPA